MVLPKKLTESGLVHEFNAVQLGLFTSLSVEELIGYAHLLEIDVRMLASVERFPADDIRSLAPPARAEATSGQVDGQETAPSGR